MKGKKRATLLLLISLISLMNLYSLDVPEDDITLAIQSLIVASASVHGLSLLTPPQESNNAFFIKNTNSNEVSLSLNKSDVGLLRTTFLSFPPPVDQPKGFFEMLLMSVTNLFPNYEFIEMYLQNQHLSAEEIILNGELSAQRTATTYPFRYEGKGVFRVEGKRISAPFTIDFSFMIPLEGTNRGEIIPSRVFVDGQDVLSIASSVFLID